MNEHSLAQLTQRIKYILGEFEPEEIPTDNFVAAGVMLLLFEKEGVYHILFQKRSQEVEHHKGEISFSGGVYDQDDLNLLTTALRETWEETGINIKDITVLGKLSTLETTTNFRIFPFVGFFRYPYPFKINRSEVDQLIEVPIRHLQNPNTYWTEEHLWTGKPRMEHYYSYHGHVIFGVTARILREFLVVIE